MQVIEKLGEPQKPIVKMKKRNQQDVLEDILSTLKEIQLDILSVNTHITSDLEELALTIKNLPSFNSKVEPPKVEPPKVPIPTSPTEKPKTSSSIVPEKWKQYLIETKDNSGVTVLRQSKRLDINTWNPMNKDLLANGWKRISAGSESHWRPKDQ